MFEPFQQHASRGMVAGAERLLGIENNLNLIRTDRHRLPAWSDDEPPADPQRLDRLRPLPVPILILHRAHNDIRFRQARPDQVTKGAPELCQTVRRPFGGRPIEMNTALILPGALNRRIPKQAHDFAGVHVRGDLNLYIVRGHMDFLKPAVNTKPVVQRSGSLLTPW